MCGFPENPLYFAIDNFAVFQNFESELQTILSHCQYRNITADFLLVDQLAEKIWDLLPINSHKIEPMPEPVEDLLKNSFVVLDKILPADWRVLKKYIGGTGYVSLKPEFAKNDTQITSITIPSFPKISFISAKAAVHIPPAKIVSETSVYYLAENIIHEATHQAINWMLVESDLFLDDYNSESSPLIEIPWRAESKIVRNRRWQMDRCLHACAVYRIAFFAGLFRLFSIARFSDDGFDVYSERTFVAI